jgi:SAM-dependent methyltransferase
VKVSPFSSADIRRYYDRNTGAFVRHGQGGALGAIHRAVWGPGVADRAQAFRFVEDRIVAAIDSLALDGPAHVVDLGCGIGASLAYIAQQRPVRGTGITLSPVQAQLGAARVAAAHLADRLRIVEGDYCALPPDLEPADVAYAIESFVHGPSPERFFAEAARILRPGGLLLICDDMRGDANAGRHPHGDPGDAAAARVIARFTRGWHVNSLLTRDELVAQARAAGFTHESTTDLTPFLELGRARDRAIALLAGATGWLVGGSASRQPPRTDWLSTRLAPLVGGAALQTALSHRWLTYDLAAFRR